jgi:hypothetical protein
MEFDEYLIQLVKYCNCKKSFQRLFNIFWDCKNLPLIPLAIDCNQSKTQKIIKSLPEIDSAEFLITLVWKII